MRCLRCPVSALGRRRACLPAGRPLLLPASGLTSSNLLPTFRATDEIHNIVGAGKGGEGAMDASNLLKPMLARGELRCIVSRPALPRPDSSWWL